VLLYSNSAFSARSSKFASELILLLGVTYTRLDDHRKCGRSGMEDLKASHGKITCTLDYNQLKRVLLRTLADSGPTDSVGLFQRLTSVGPERFEIHAVRMALVRYYRQGLLKRERSGGQFRYSLSGRGTARLRWLEGQTKNSPTE